MDSNAPDWRALLERAVSAAGVGGITKVADRLGVSRTYVSLVLSRKKDPVPQAFVGRVINRLYVVAECPATGHPQPRSECSRLAKGAAPTHNPLAMRIWKCCQTCAHKPEV
ncbi:hypothetical protein dqs_0589 [Azoarcus olearius]|uniref:hypothetical protein n=1 Tax=Azoarcus sp. (strain BH72) TaxID=418699 RepID=UPI0008060AE4|nr:hypothetical protein [Azoarcus olearius]ANQ83665.1 hypothetical protein dqs_0589 [Azoarcus olearius]